MKQIYLYICIVVLGASSLAAQNSGTGIPFRSMLRNTGGQLIQNKEVTIKATLTAKQGGTPIWAEEQLITSNLLGVIDFSVGKGKRIAGTVTAFKEIDFSEACWLKVEYSTDATTFTTVSERQLPAAPYAESVYKQTAPPGTILTFAGPVSKIPEGWAECDGRALKRIDYPELYMAIETVSGAEGPTPETSSEYFNIPDFRGLFLRAASEYDNSGTYEKNVLHKGANTLGVGAYQPHATKEVRHYAFILVPGQSVVDTPPQGVFSRQQNTTTNFVTCPNTERSGTTTWSTIKFDLSRSGVRTASEFRPDNICVVYIIKL